MSEMVDPSQRRMAYLVRHAKTDYNVRGPGGRFCGRSDPALNESGESQAVLTAAALGTASVSRLLSSPLKRSLQTAQVISEALRVPIEIEENLREIDYGAWEGLTKEQVGERYPEELALFDQDPIANPPPGGEPPEEALRRIEEIMRQLIADTAVVVAHKTILRLYLCTLDGRPLSEYRSYADLHLASITRIILPEPGHVLEYDSVYHLSS